VLAALIFAGGFADLNPERYNHSLFAVCKRADSFFPGDCNVDDAAFVGRIPRLCSTLSVTDWPLCVQGS
jgi:hypothetical protein